MKKGLIFCLNNIYNRTCYTKFMIKILLLIMLLLLPLFSKPLEKVNLQLQWLNQFQFAGYYVAKEKGFYKQEGIDVSFLPYSKYINYTNAVLANEATYAIGRANVIVNKSKGAPIVLLSALLQSSPLVLVALDSSHIKSVSDCKHKRIMLTNEETQSADIRAMLTLAGVSIDDLSIIPQTFNVQDLIDKKVDLMAVYTSNELYTLDKKHIKYTIFDPKDYGFDFYSDILFTSQKELQEHPQRVEKFLNATLKGWQYAFSHINETVALILKKYNTQHKTKAALVYEAQLLKYLAYYDNKELGNIDILKVEKIYDLFKLLGLTDKSIDMQKFIYDTPVNTRTALLTQEEKVYLQKKKVIKVCSDPNWMPFEKIENGKLTGMSGDFLKIVSERINTPFQILPVKSWQESVQKAKKRECDIFSLAMPTPSRQKYMDFTQPYLSIPLVIATKPQKPFISDIAKNLDKTYGVVKGYAFTELLRLQYPSIKFKEYPNIKKGLNAVVSGQVYGFIDNLSTIAYHMQREYQGALKISGKFSQKWQLGYASRNDEPLLHSILNKAIASIDDKTKQLIVGEWVKVVYQRGFDYRLFYILFGVVAFVILFLLLQYRIMHIYNIKLQENMDIIDTYVMQTVSDLEGNITNVSEAFTKLYGYTKEELLGKNYRILKHPDSDRSFIAKFWKTIQSGKTYEGEFHNIAKDGKTIWMKQTVFPIQDKFGNNIAYHSFGENITDKKHIEELSITDKLTGLKNRLYLDKVYEEELQRAQRYATPFCIIILDIDDFKNINDTYGHLVGDIVLKQLSRLLFKHIRKSDMLGRWGGEEFLIIAPQTEYKAACNLAEKLRLFIAKEDFEAIGHMTCSFGVGVYSRGDQSTEPVKRADDALYEAKKAGKNRVCCLHVTHSD